MSSYDAEGGPMVVGDGAVVPAASLHPKLVTHRRDNESRPNSARLTPRSTSAAVPTNEELAEAGVTAQDGAVRQLSARKDERGSLAGPREVPSPIGSGRRAPDAITAGGGVGQSLQLSEPRQRRAISGTPREQPPPPQQKKQQQQQQQQPRPASRHAPGDGVTRHTAGAGSSREPIRPGRSSRPSSTRSPSKHGDPYAHVTSVLHEYRNNHISALEAQYKTVRSHSTASAAHGDASAVAGRGASTHSGRAAHGAERAGEALLPARSSSTSSRRRQGSPQPREVEAEYHRAGVPRAALDAPHIRYAEALQNMHNRRSASAQRRSYLSSMPSNTPAEFLPDVATYIPDRLKYVPPTEEERRLHRETTLRILEEWRERQRAISSRNRNAPVQMGNGRAEAGLSNRTPSKNRARTRSQQPPPAHSPLSAAYASSESQLLHSDEEEARAARTQQSRSARARGSRPRWSSDVSPRRRAASPGAAAEQRDDDDSTNEDPGEWRGRRSSARRGAGTPRSARSGRASSRKGRRSPQVSARSASGAVNANAYRRRLVFDVVAPTVSIP